ncbi:hypothetical protein PHACT_15315 [Pseudohongiella acticola]|uniref:Extensin-like C-terminal domain-containing protein n=1 Tax=Pseudohongiella acticola TaxID=1524254 RepID=A0A1E8CG77_9GAMM|nr:extensin family protein [Pseudohongiella acticola]OFE11207.1 hypothetical protein PHACT_15315 [Pseudohongiella acticola]
MAVRRLLLTGAVALTLSAAITVLKPWQHLPDHWNPASPLSLTHPMNPVTKWKLARLNDSPQRCLEVLASAPDNFLDYLPLEDYTPVENCPLRNVVRITRTGIEFSSPVTIACPLLVRWSMYEYQALQPLALTHLDSAIDSVAHLGTFACRNVYGRETGRRSEHATASALDVAGFTMENGDDVNVLRDWDSDSAAAKAAFLRASHEAACGYFGATLGPEYNAAHANHFHLDSSRFGLCQ